MNLKKQVVGILLALAVPVCALAQSVTVKGQVKDGAGEPLMAAAVAEVGTSNGVATDLDGNYTITVASNATLQFSFMGYNTVTEPVRGRTTINVTLSEDVELLDEVVVVGYGTQRKKLVTTSTVNITSDKIAATNSIDAIGAIQSQAAGINITSNSGSPVRVTRLPYVVWVLSETLSLCTLLTVFPAVQSQPFHLTILRALTC